MVHLKTGKSEGDMVIGSAFRGFIWARFFIKYNKLLLLQVFWFTYTEFLSGAGAKF